MQADTPLSLYASGRHALHAYGLDARLGFQGEIPIWASLTVIVATLTVTTLASLWKSRRDAANKIEEFSEQSA